MSIGALLCAWALFSAEAEPPKAAEGPKVLLVLSTDTDLYGQIMREADGEIFFARQGKPLRFSADLVVRRVSASSIDAEIAERQKRLPKDDVAAHLRLALLCYEVERSGAALQYVMKAQELMLKPPEIAQPQPTGPQGTPGASSLPGVPGGWPAPENASFAIQVKKVIKTELSEDTMRAQRLRNLFAMSGTPFSMVDPPGADYVIKIRLESTMVKENTFYGAVPVSREWEGKVSCIVHHVKSDKIVFQMKDTVLRDTLPLVAKDEEILNKAWEQFTQILRKEPTFRFKKEAPSTATGTLRKL